MIKISLFSSISLFTLLQFSVKNYQVHGSSSSLTGGLPISTTKSGGWTSYSASSWRYFRRKPPSGQTATIFIRKALNNLFVSRSKNNDSASDKNDDLYTSSAKRTRKFRECSSGHSMPSSTVKGTDEVQNQSKEKIKEHPLRTDEWEIHYKSGLFKSTRNSNYMLNLDPLYKILSKYLLQHRCTSCEQDTISNNRVRMTSKTAATVVRFHRNGFCKFSPIAIYSYQFNDIATASTGNVNSGTTRTTSLRLCPHIGRWKLNNHGSVHWDVPISILLDTHTYFNTSDDIGSNTIKLGDKTTIETKIVAFTTLHFVADLHINRFGAHPKMHKGVVTCDRFIPSSSFYCCSKEHRKSKNSKYVSSTLFRPVVGSFIATGVGIDTLDNTYKKRRIGMFKN